MAGSLTGIGGQQQVQLASSLQTATANPISVRRDETQQSRENVIQPLKAETAQPSKSNASGNQRTEDGAAVRASAETSSGRRGSLVDITV